MITVDLANEQSTHPIDEDLLRRAVEVVLAGEQIAHASISIAVVDDGTIHQLNRAYLSHDYATDVLSFNLNEPNEPLEGEVVVSAEMAARKSVEYGWTMMDELLLYVIHGTLHLVGYDDASESERNAMKTQETKYLATLGRSEQRDAHASHGNARPLHGGPRT